MTRFRVGVRVSPISPRERESGARDVIAVRENGTSLELFHVDKAPYSSGIVEEAHRDRVGCLPGRINRVFNFDFCLASHPEGRSDPTQADVYEVVGLPALTSMLEGYNSCIFAYGQSGTGKTYTIRGTENDAGLLFRICEGLFREIRLQTGRTFDVDVSFLELYKERVYDLLQESRVLRLREHPQHGPFAEGLKRRRIFKAEDVDLILKEIQQNRSKEIREDSHKSSHMVFTLRCQQELEEKRILVSELHLVDLAGSERLPEDEPGFRKQQISNVNKSLVTLGIVISALAESCKRRSGWSEHSSKRSAFVPFRSSALTWLLKETLGGNCVTCVIATVSSSSTCYRDTLSTLRYAEQARNIRNTPVVNELRSRNLVLRKALHNSRRERGIADKSHVMKERMKREDKVDKDEDLPIMSYFQAPSRNSKERPSLVRFRSQSSLQCSQLSSFYVLRRCVTLNTCVTSCTAVVQPQSAQLLTENQRDEPVINADVREKTELLEPQCFEKKAEVQNDTELKTSCIADHEDLETEIQNSTEAVSSVIVCPSPRVEIVVDQVRPKKSLVHEDKYEQYMSRSYSQATRAYCPNVKLWRSCPSLRTELVRTTDFHPTQCSRHLPKGYPFSGACFEGTNLRPKRPDIQYSTDSVDGSRRSIPLTQEGVQRGSNEQPETRGLPFRLQHYSRSPEPAIFPDHRQELKSFIWPEETKKCSSTSSLDSITYVFLDQDQSVGNSVPETSRSSTQEWVTNNSSHAGRATRIRQCSLSTLDSLEVERADQEEIKSPRTLSVDSVLLEECVRSVTAERSLPNEQDQLLAQKVCESSGISSKSDSSSISVESASSSITTRRRDSLLVSSSFAVPDVRPNLQADLINLMTEVVQLLAVQQQRRICRCRSHRRRTERKGKYPEHKDKDDGRCKFPQEQRQKKKEDIQKQIFLVRAERMRVKDMLVSTESQETSYKCVLSSDSHQLVVRQSQRKSQETLPSGATSRRDCDGKMENRSDWKVLEKQSLSDHRHLHDSGVDCGADYPSLNQETKGKTGTETLSGTLSRQPVKTTFSVPRETPPRTRKPEICVPPATGLASRSEAEKDRLLTWMEKELDFLDRAFGPVHYKTLPDRFKNTESLFLPVLPKERLRLDKERGRLCLGLRQS